MIVLPSAVLALLDAGRTDVRGLIRFDLGTGTYGFVKALAPFEYGGLTYQPGGVIEVSDISGGVGVAARQFSVTLAASSDDALTPAMLQTIESEDYRDRPVTIYDAHFHPDTGALLHVQAMKRGYVDVIDHEDDASGGYRLVAQCESRALDYTRTNGRKRTPADQARRAPGDKFFDNAASRLREEIHWGRLKTGAGLPAPAAAPQADPYAVLRGLGLPF